MRAGIFCLTLAYCLSQFYRAFLAVLSPVLQADLGITADDLATASGLWFFAFAAMQIPIGEALDRVGPRLTAAVLHGIGGLGVCLFALANGAVQIQVAMALIGVGCAPVLMASYYIFARIYPAAVFATLAAFIIAIGNLGNIAATVPLAWGLETFGWRATVWGMAGLTLAVATAVLVFVRDPARLPPGEKGSLLDLLRMRALWPVMLMMAACYAPGASLRGLWVGPWFADAFGADAARIGTVTLWMGLAMIAGNFAYGPMDRWLGTRKGVVIGGNVVVLLAFIGLWALPQDGAAVSVALIVVIGAFGATFPVVMAHGRAFLPAHLMGRGVTLINLFGLGAAGLVQIATGRIHAAGEGLAPVAQYGAVFLFLAAVVAVGLVIYAFAQDRTD
ncbi:MAG: MFS transporter [Paracoccaceae bacterium]